MQISCGSSVGGTGVGSGGSSGVAVGSGGSSGVAVGSGGSSRVGVGEAPPPEPDPTVGVLVEKYQMVGVGVDV